MSDTKGKRDDKRDDKRDETPDHDADVEGHSIAEGGDDEVAYFNINLSCN